MPIEIVTEVTQDLVDTMGRLLPQLSRSAPPLSAEDLQQILDQDGVYLFLHRDAETGTPLGVLTLVTFQIPTGNRAWVEDVVVDQAARGRGVGRELVEASLNKARELGCRTVDLTSRPSREAANRLYQAVGFELRETNVYRYTWAD